MNKESFTMIDNRIFSQGRYLSIDAKWLYATLLSFRNTETQETFPGYAKITERSGLKKQRIADALKELEQFHWISRERRGFNKSNSYALHYPVRWDVSSDGERSLSNDQTCPTYAEAEDWKNKTSRKRRGASPSYIPQSNSIGDDYEIPF